MIRSHLRRRAGFSLADLFLLLAACAVCFALVRSAAGRPDQYRIDWYWVGSGLLVGGVLGIVIGGFVAYSMRRSPATVAIGCCGGWVSGTAAGGLLTTGANAWMYLVGSAVLVIVALFFRFTARGD